jgi:hypothetical protein
MFAVKLFCENIKTNSILERTAKNISDYLKDNMRRELNTISDSKSIEMVSGNLDANDGGVVVELMIKKTLFLEKEDLHDRQKLDKLIREVKHFCEQASSVEDLKYLPINYRD